MADFKKIKKIPKEVPVKNLRWRCPESYFKFKTTDDLRNRFKIIGQPRAIHAIQTGLDIDHPGYNIFVTGLTGTGRSTTVKQILKRLDKVREVPDDKLYVNNFKDPDQPRLIRLPAGGGREFKKEMMLLVDHFQDHLPSIFESDDYKKKIEEVTDTFRLKQRSIFQKFEEKMTGAGFAVVQIQMGSITRPDIMPVVETSPMPFEEIEKLVHEEKFSPETLRNLRQKYGKYRQDLDKMLSRGRTLEKKLREEIEKVVEEFVAPYVECYVDDIRQHHKDNAAVNEYLDEIFDYTLSEIGIFIQSEERAKKMAAVIGTPQDPFRGYEVNLLVDNSRGKRAPVVIEKAPNFKNLFGTIEKVVDRSGNWTSDFMNIKGGSVLRADGGFLVINLLESISEPYVWRTLKRTLKYGQLQIEPAEALTFFGQSALKPEPVTLNLKVVLIGDKQHYLMLFNQDEDFKKIFKISADFTDQMDRTKKHILDYSGFINQLTREEKIQPLTPSGVAAVIEESIRMADRQDKLSARFSDVADLIREAGHWAKDNGSKTIERKDVEKALREQVYRKQMIEDRMQEYITNGVIMVDTSGAKKGQINGLAVYGYGEYAFGKPSKITATVSLGKSGIINIEREAELSGKIHDKGIQILSGFLRARFAQDKPLALTASICFEQSYGGIDGDSASSTELYLILASLAGLPLRQDIAVTGSVNQHGEIQPIGGANQKIEGFFEICKHRRLTGTQGVIIPHQNVQDLQLKPDVVEAVEQGKFHIWAVKTVEDGLEILTGVKAGKRQRNGKWEKGTLFAKADDRLQELALGIQKFYAAHETKSGGKGGRPDKNKQIPPPPPKQPTRSDDREGGSD